MKQLKTSYSYTDNNICDNSNNRSNKPYYKPDGYCISFNGNYRFNGKSNNINGVRKNSTNNNHTNNAISKSNGIISHPLTLKDIDHIPLKDLITKSPVELFSIRKQCLIDYEVSKQRKNWLCNVIEMKYREDINNLLEKTKKYFECVDTYNIIDNNNDNINKIPYFIKDQDSTVEVEFIRKSKNSSIQVRLSLSNDIKEVSND